MRQVQGIRYPLLLVCCCRLQVELQVQSVHVVSRAAGALPFELVDAARSDVSTRGLGF